MTNLKVKIFFKFNRLVLISIKSLLTIILLGCAGSQVPLSLPGDASVDRQLIGVWVEADNIIESEKDKMTIYQFNDYEYLIEFLSKETTKTELLRLRGYATTISDVLFANVQCIECDDDNDYIFFRYELTKEDILKIRPIKTELYKDPLFTSSQVLFDFISNRMNDDEIYEKESNFRRAE